MPLKELYRIELTCDHAHTHKENLKGMTRRYVGWTTHAAKSRAAAVGWRFKEDGGVICPHCTKVLFKARHLLRTGTTLDNWWYETYRAILPEEFE
jgi:hypothetical protein